MTTAATLQAAPTVPASPGDGGAPLQLPLCSARARFLDSLAARLIRMVDGLERWRRNRPSAEADADLLLACRELHTLSGTAGTLGYAPLAASAAALHALLGSLIALRQVPAPETIDQAIDALLGTAMEARLAAEESLPPPRKGARAHVLVVDDETDLLAITSARLGHAGFLATGFDDGESALRALASLTPDVVVVDWNMPLLSGASLLRRIRALPAFRALPVIVYSSCDTPAEQAAMRGAGADETVSKLAAPALLLAAVQRQLQRRPAAGA